MPRCCCASAKAGSIVGCAAESSSWCREQFLDGTGTLSFGWQLVTVMTMTAGTVFLMWLGEQIDEFGIGNGISLLIMAGILAAMPGGRRSSASNRRSNWAAAGASWGWRC